MTFLPYFIAAFIGHFVGDYLFQNQWMAIGKSQPGMRGALACTVHVLLYTLAIALFTVQMAPVPRGVVYMFFWEATHVPAYFVFNNPWFLFLLAVFVPHWIIDRWSLATYILRLKNGYSPWAAWTKAPSAAKAQTEEEKLVLNVWNVAFAAPVYIFNDNTLHWVCLWFACKWFFRS
jgi:hypothetical protein